MADEMFSLTTATAKYSLDLVNQDSRSKSRPKTTITNRIQGRQNRVVQGGGGIRPFPDFGRYVNPISIRGQIMPITLLLALPSPRFTDLLTVLEWKR